MCYACIRNICVLQHCMKSTGTVKRCSYILKGLKLPKHLLPCPLEKSLKRRRLLYIYATHDQVMFVRYLKYTRMYVYM